MATESVLTNKLLTELIFISGSTVSTGYKWEANNFNNNNNNLLIINSN